MNQELNPRWTLMQGLYYPAVLGTGLVLLINKFATHTKIVDTASDTSIYFGILLVVYFSASFWANHTISPKDYNTIAFIADFAEIIVIFLDFYFLGFFNTTNHYKIDFHRLYLLLAFLPILQQIWNYAIGGDKSLYKLSAIAVTILLASGFWGYRYMWWNISMIFVLAGLIGIYLNPCAAHGEKRLWSKNSATLTRPLSLFVNPFSRFFAFNFADLNYKSKRVLS